MTPAFQPTLMMKLLGRNYKWWYSLYFSYKSNGTALSGHLFGQISDIIQSLAIGYVWIINGSNNSVVTYLVVGRIYKALSDTLVSGSLGSLILSGKISNLLIVPQHFIWLIFFREIGKRAVFNLGRAAGCLVAIVVYQNYISLGSWNKYLGFGTIRNTYFILSFISEFLFGSLSFFIKDPRNWDGFGRAYGGILSILTGIIIPLDKLPGYDFLKLLPTSYVIHHPMQIYLGKYSPIETLYVFLGGITWCLILYLLAKVVFKLGLKRNVAVGL